MSWFVSRLREWRRALARLLSPSGRGSGESEESFLVRSAAAIDAVTDEADRLCGVANAPRERRRTT